MYFFRLRVKEIIYTKRRITLCRPKTKNDVMYATKPFTKSYSCDVRQREN